MPFISSVRGSFGPAGRSRRFRAVDQITGGTITTAGGYRIHTFTNIGANTFNIAPGYTSGSGLTTEYTILAGGGSGSTSHGGGAGAGGAVYVSSNSLLPGSYPITVGAGSPRSTSTAQRNGGDSTFNGITTFGGGGGGYSQGFNGGCGSGSGHTNTTAGVTLQASSGYGSTGGVGYGFNGAHTNGNSHSAAGGGGIGSRPNNSTQSGPNSATTGNTPGGNGRVLTMIQGTAVGGGGGGGAHSGAGPGNVGGLGTDGGGNGSPEGVGGGDATRYGAGGGGGGHAQSQWGGGAGGNGIIVIRYPI
jgi:hypothetical protein